MSTQIVRPAGAGHETLFALLLCLMIVLVAGSWIAWLHQPEPINRVAAHQLDARRDLSAAEQGIYADLWVTLDEIQLLTEDTGQLPTPRHLAVEGFAPFASDASSISRGGHAWQLLGPQGYLGLSPNPAVAGSFLLRMTNTANAAPDIWLNRNPTGIAPTDFSDQALSQTGWQQVIAQFDAGVTRQHRH